MDGKLSMRNIFPKLLLVALIAAFLAGCRGKPDPKDEGKASDPATPATPASLKENAARHAFLHQTFKQAIVTEVSRATQCPPEKTAAGKSVARMYEQIAGPDGIGGLWDQIRFLTPEGQAIHYWAVVKTDLGDIHIELWPETAPNHVRSFIALAKVGYYDGLAVDLISKEKLDDEWVTYLVAGCPLSTGAPGYGSIGYWLRPEISDKLVHEEGTIGAWHDDTLDSAACKFYITLTKAPGMDRGYTIFGKITQGLDIARKISQLPLQEGETGRPKEPVIIRKITIHSQ